jgi:hypothetical protein
MASNGNGHPAEVFHMLTEGLHRGSVTAMFALDCRADHAGHGDVAEEFIPPR